MPKIEDINNSLKKTFKKRDYRPWNSDGDKIIQNHSFPDKSTINCHYESNNNIILELETSIIKNWDFHDRPENELGDLDSLAQEFIEIGQQQPCIIRPLQFQQDGFQYELIVGERRWRAATIANLNLKVIIKSLSDSEAALIQASENHNRKDLSDYARGMSYANLIERGIVTQKDLTEKLQMSKQQISRLISFSKIPTNIINAIGDMSRISSKTAEQIKQLSSKGTNYTDAIIEIADKLREGEIGWEKLKLLVEQALNNTPKLQDKSFKIYNQNGKIYSKNGRHLFTWRHDNNACPALHFPKDISILIRDKKLNIDNLSNKISEVIEKILLEI